MPRLRTRSTHTPTTDHQPSTTRKTRRPQTVSLAENPRKTSRKFLTATDVTEKITPTKQNGRVAKRSGEWVEEEIAEGQDAVFVEAQEKNVVETANKEELKGKSVEESFEAMEEKSFAEKPGENVQKTPDRRSTFELESSINSVEVLKRDSVLERNKNASLGNGKVLKKKKRSTETRNLRKKINTLLETTTPPSILEVSNKANLALGKDDSVIEISSDENSPALLKERGRQKLDLLKYTLSKKFNANFAELSCPRKTRKKMPDFAAIHRKNFEQMEDIASMTKRREERAKLLLSGSKPSPLKARNDGGEGVRAKLFAEPEIGGQKRVPSTPKVRFTPETRNSPLGQFALAKTPKPALAGSHKKLISTSKSSPLQTRNINTEEIQAKVFAGREMMGGKGKLGTPKVRFTPETRNTPPGHFALPKTPKPTLGSHKKLLSTSKSSPLQTRNTNNIEGVEAKVFPGREIMDRKGKLTTPKVRFTPETRNTPPAHFPLPKTPKPAVVESLRERRKTKEGFTRYGFKKIAPIEVQVAVVATKNTACAVAGGKERRKEVLKGVRTNRRFELLMAMRKGQH